MQDHGEGPYGAGVAIEDPTLADRAARAGVATEYADWARQRVVVAPEAVEAALAVVGSPAPPALVTAGPAPATGKVTLEDGRTVEVTAGDPLPAGVHRFASADVPLVVAPPALPDPLGRRAWGWQVQLYQLRSARSWGIGDYADLATLAGAFGAQGADVLLVNPMHALTPVHPVQPSPYFPSSRRFADQLAVAVDLLPEYRSAAGVGARGGGRAPAAARRPDRPGRGVAGQARGPRDAAAGVGPGRPGRAGGASRSSARWPSSTARTGGAGRRRCGGPAGRRPRRPSRTGSGCTGGSSCGPSSSSRRRSGPPGRPGWRSGWCTTWPSARTRSARTRGCCRTTWPPAPRSVRRRTRSTSSARTGASRRSGRTGSRETGFAAYRQVVRAALRHGGGLRVDHVMGLFRLWWVPRGRGAAGGTYVRYDAPAMLAVLVLEAARAGALVVGEDLGTVEPSIRTALDRAGVLGSAVLWFAREDDEITPLPPARYRERAVASVSTHDLPTAYGLLASEQVRVRAALGQLDRPVAEEEARVDAERDRLLAMMRAEGLAAPGTPDDELVLDMYRLLTRTPCRVVLASPADAVGDLRQPNLPGTTDEYPNWRLPLADRAGAPGLPRGVPRRPRHRPDRRAARLRAAVLSRYSAPPRRRSAGGSRRSGRRRWPAG